MRKPQTNPQPGPISAAEQITPRDAIRSIAVLNILPMNALAYASANAADSVCPRPDTCRSVELDTRSRAHCPFRPIHSGSANGHEITRVPAHRLGFCNTIFSCGHPLLGRHGVNDLDIQHAVAHSLAIEDVGEDPDRWLVIGTDRAGNLLELVVPVDQRGEIVIHAMALRPKYRKLLEP